MKKVMRLTESDLVRLVNKVIKEQSSSASPCPTNIKGRVETEGKELIFMDFKNIKVVGSPPHLKMDIQVPNMSVDKEELRGATAKFRCVNQKQNIIFFGQKNGKPSQTELNISKETFDKLNCHCLSYAKTKGSNLSSGMA